MSTIIEHPDIKAAQLTGWPIGLKGENPDTEEARLEVVMDHPKELVEFLLAGDADIIDRFMEHYAWQYKNWLN